MPRQKFKLEIANIPARTREMMPLIANYESVRAMPTVYVNAESLNEIMADNILAFPTSLLDNKGNPVALDSAKIRHRDIWDLAWLSRQEAKLDPTLVAAKIGDYGVEDYKDMLGLAINLICVQGPNAPLRRLGHSHGGEDVGHRWASGLLLEFGQVGALFSTMSADLASAMQSIQSPVAEPNSAAKAKRTPGLSMWAHSTLFVNGSPSGVVFCFASQQESLTTDQPSLNKRIASSSRCTA